jgi:hypothetical protein
MAVITRELRKIDGKEEVVRVFKTKKLLTGELKQQAENLDKVIEKKMRGIEKELKNSGYLALKGKKGKVHKLYHEVGKHLDFVMDTSLISAEDREFVWRALYDHAGELAPGPLSERARRNPETSHFSYCYKLAQFSWEFVESAGDWTSWSEFFDRSETKNDPRIIEWLGNKAKEINKAGRQGWLRPLTKAIHREFEKKDTTVFSRQELSERLERLLSENLNIT